MACALAPFGQDDGADGVTYTITRSACKGILIAGVAWLPSFGQVDGANRGAGRYRRNACVTVNTCDKACEWQFAIGSSLSGGANSEQDSFTRNAFGRRTATSVHAVSIHCYLTAVAIGIGLVAITRPAVAKPGDGSVGKVLAVMVNQVVQRHANTHNLARRL